MNKPEISSAEKIAIARRVSDDINRDPEDVRGLDWDDPRRFDAAVREHRAAWARWKKESGS